jgi:hypothetical protein
MDENNFDEIEKIGISYSQNNSRDDIIKKDTNLNGVIIQNSLKSL